MASEKRCSGCGELKPLTAFAKHPGHSDGRQSVCRACFNLRRREIRAANPERYAYHFRKKVCPRCGGAMSPSATKMCQQCYLLELHNPPTPRAGAVTRKGAARRRQPIWQCSRCGLRKPSDAFPSTAKGLRSVCKACKTAATRRWKVEHAEEFRGKAIHYARAHRLGISIAEYRRRGLHELDWDRCQICAGGRDGEGSIHMDHCHGCRAFRGVACRPCNTILGLAGDDPARLRALADYLEAHSCGQPVTVRQSGAIA